MGLLSRKKLAMMVLVCGPVLVGVDRVFLADNGPSAAPAGGGVVNAAVNAVVHHAMTGGQQQSPGIADALSGLLETSGSQAGGGASFDAMSEVFGILSPPPSADAAGAGSEVPVLAGYRVSAVLGAGDGAAIINGGVVRVGEATGDATLLRVEERTAVLLVDGEEVSYTVR